MPLIIVRTREGVLSGKEQKKELIEKMSAVMGEVLHDPGYIGRTTVIIEEIPNDNWGRGGKQVSDLES